MMDVHIGELIEERIAEVGITKAEFGRRINTSRQNVNTILKKRSLDTSVLRNICRVLNFDFFQYYSLETIDPNGSKKDQPAEQPGFVSIMINVPAEAQDRILSALFEGRVPSFLNTGKKQ